MIFAIKTGRGILGFGRILSRTALCNVLEELGQLANKEPHSKSPESRST